MSETHDDSGAFYLCLGAGELLWEFRNVAIRDQVWHNLTTSDDWQPEWATKRGDGSGARCSIVFHIDLMPTMYRWKCAFSNAAII